MSESTIKNEEEVKGPSGAEAEKPWLEKQVEKIIGRQENMQPIIRLCFSIVGFVAGFVIGNWVLGKEKDRKIESLAEKAKELREENEELEEELKESKKQLAESKEKQMSAEVELKVLKEKQGVNGRELSGASLFKATQHHYLD